MCLHEFSLTACPIVPLEKGATTGRKKDATRKKGEECMLRSFDNIVHLSVYS